MKKLIPLLLMLAAMNTQAQFVPQNKDDKELQNFLKTKMTYVHKMKVPEFDSLLEDAMKKYWKVSPFTMGIPEEAKKKTDNNNISVLMPHSSYVTISNGNYSVTRSNMELALFSGGYRDYYPAEMVGFVCIDQKHNPKDWYDDLSIYDAMLREKYRIKDMIATLNRALEIVRDGGAVIKTPDVTFGVSTVSQVCKACAESVTTMAAEVYNKELPRLKTKTLYLLKDNFRDTRDLAKAYPYKFKVVDRKEYEKAISEERSGIAYLMLTHSYWGGITVIDPSAHECIGAIHIDKCTTIDAGDLGDLVKLMEKVEKDKNKKK
ncbi:MAG: hypothetical protein U0T74_13925 [Chitinophagales bacterium]